jgi:hypothetical protein
MTKDNKYVCPGCNRELKELKRLEKHGVTLKPDEDRDMHRCDPEDTQKARFCCPMCGYEGPDRDAFVPLS